MRNLKELNTVLGYDNDFTTLILCTPAVKQALEQIKKYGYLNNVDLQRQPRKTFVSEIKKAISNYRG